jgi:fatty acid synthase, animal type
MLPIAIQKLLINPNEHTSIIRELDPVDTILPVEASRYMNKLRCGGVEMYGLLLSPINRRNPTSHVVLEHYTFIPHLPAPIMSQSEAVRVLTQLALENCQALEIKAVELGIEGRQPIITKFSDAITDLPNVTANMILFSSKNITLNEIHVENGKLATQTNCTFIIAVECLTNSLFLQQAKLSLNEGGYIVSREKLGMTVQNVTVPAGFQLLATIPTEDETLVLMQHQKSKTSVVPQLITTTTENYSWLSEVKNAMKKGPVVVLAQNENLSGVVGMVNCIRKETNGQTVSVVFIDDSKAPPFELNHPLYNSYMQLGLAINVFKDVCIINRNLLQVLLCSTCLIYLRAAGEAIVI